MEEARLDASRHEIDGKDEKARDDDDDRPAREFIAEIECERSSSKERDSSAPDSRSAHGVQLATDAEHGVHVCAQGREHEDKMNGSVAQEGTAFAEGRMNFTGLIWDVADEGFDGCGVNLIHGPCPLP